tara:strand:- start:642 stop:959 length:318 start_codon:yes stop_codon:yes gene_type:complete
MQKTEPTWSAERVQVEAEKHYNDFVDEFQGQDPAAITSALLKEISELRAIHFQLVEHLSENWLVSSGAASNSHIAVQKFQELEATMKSQGRNFSERLERLERKSG